MRIRRAAVGEWPFDVAAGRWVELPPMPEGRHHVAIAAFDGEIYVFGGADDSWRATATTPVYEIDGNRWRAAAPMPQVRYAAAAVVVDRHIYVVGGDGPGGHGGLLLGPPRALGGAPDPHRRGGAVA